ncbi:hypothetical protein OKW35_000063 [Paraburkholderia sp. MM5477-R1]
MNDHRKMPRRFARRAARLNALCRRLGLTPLSDERIQASFESRERRRAEVRKANDRYAGCLSVTATAQGLGVRRTHLFELLEEWSWLARDEVGATWRATDDALADGWVVQRGPESISWVQLTPSGQGEIARRLGLDPNADGDR